VREQAGLRRPGVVRRDEQQPGGAALLGLAGQLDGVAGVVGADPGEDVRTVALPALRHRLILNFDAESAGVTTDAVLTELLSTLPE